MSDQPITAEQIGLVAAAEKALAEALHLLGIEAETAEQKSKGLIERIKALAPLLSSVVEPSKLASEAINFFSEAAKKAHINIQNMNNLTEPMASKLALVSAGFINARAGFEGLAGVDTSGLVTMTNDFSLLSSALTKGGPAGAAVEAALTSIAKATGGTTEAAKATDAFKIGGSTALAYAKNLMVGVDNVYKMQNAMYQLTAQSGKMNSTLKGVGTDFGGDKMVNMNELMTKQTQIMKEAEDATGLEASQIQAYWGELSNVPGALNNMTVSLSATNKNVNTLTATIDIAKATGYDYKRMMGDIAVSTTLYGTSMAGAIKFTSSIAEAGSRAGIPLKEMREAILNGVGAFKMFATSEAEADKQVTNISESMGRYALSLKNVGVSSGNAAALATQMTTAVAGLRIEQLAFLSQQTGGPGGLMGGYKIQKMLRDDPAAAMDLVKKQMMQQMGGKNIVDLDDAGKSQGAAAQYTKQVLMLQQGPLAQLAKTTGEADAILRSWTKGDAMPSQTKAFGIDDQLARGKTVEDLGKNPLTVFRSALESTLMNVNVLNFNTMKNALGVLPGSRIEDSAATTKYRDALVARAPHETKELTNAEMMTNDLKRGEGLLANVAGYVASGLKKILTSSKEDGDKKEASPTAERVDFAKQRAAGISAANTRTSTQAVTKPTKVVATPPTPPIPPALQLSHVAEVAPQPVLKGISPLESSDVDSRKYGSASGKSLFNNRRGPIEANNIDQDTSSASIVSKSVAQAANATVEQRAKQEEESEDNKKEKNITIEVFGTVVLEDIKGNQLGSGVLQVAPGLRASRPADSK